MITVSLTAKSGLFAGVLNSATLITVYRYRFASLFSGRRMNDPHREH